MKCPYCNDEMAAGIFGNGRPMLWYSNRDFPGQTFRTHQKMPKDTWPMHSITAHYCKYCNILLAEPTMMPYGIEHSIERGKEKARTFYKKLKKEDF